MHVRVFSGGQCRVPDAGAGRPWSFQTRRELWCDTEKVSGDQAGVRLLRLVALCAALALYTLWIRPRMLTWGATSGEAMCRYPGDELVPDPDGGATMAAVLPAPPGKV